MNGSMLMPTLFLGMIFILLFRKGYSKPVLAIAVVLAVFTTIYDIKQYPGSGYVMIFVSAFLLFYDAIYGVILIRKAYAEGRKGRKKNRYK